MKRDGHIMATDLMLWCSNNEPAAPAPGKDDFHMETVCTLLNIIGNAARSSVKVGPGACRERAGSVCRATGTPRHEKWACRGCIRVM